MKVVCALFLGLCLAVGGFFLGMHANSCSWFQDCCGGSCCCGCECSPDCPNGGKCTPGNACSPCCPKAHKGCCCKDKDCCKKK